MRTNGASVAIWERVIQFDRDMPPTAARSLLKLRFSASDHNRMSKLPAKARAGRLTSREQLQMDTFEQLGCLLDILHSKARRALKNRRTAG